MNEYRVDYAGMVPIHCHCHNASQEHRMIPNNLAPMSVNPPGLRVCQDEANVKRKSDYTVVIKVLARVLGSS